MSPGGRHHFSGKDDSLEFLQTPGAVAVDVADQVDYLVTARVPRLEFPDLTSSDLTDFEIAAVRQHLFNRAVAGGITEGDLALWENGSSRRPGPGRSRFGGAGTGSLSGC